MITGTDAPLLEIRRKMTGFPRAVQSDLLALYAATISQRVTEGFDNSRDPFGRPWAPLKVRVGGEPLLDTYRLWNSIKTRVVRGGITVSTTLAYAAVHQYGHTFKERRTVTVHGDDGRFVSRRRTRALRSGSVPVSFGRRGATEIPARPYLPPEDVIPPFWADELIDETSDWLRVYFS